MTVQAVNYRGRKGVVGKVCFGNEGLAFFAGYHECECGNRGKILLNIDDAKNQLVAAVPCLHVLFGLIHLWQQPRQWFLSLVAVRFFVVSYNPYAATTAN